MHNGVLIDEGCYYGPWMTEIIKGLAGHHEPQEEVIFDAIVWPAWAAAANPGVRRSSSSAASGPTTRCGSAGICRAGGPWRWSPTRSTCEIGRRNAELNGLTDRIEFVHGAVGDDPGELMEFRTESTGEVIPVRSARSGLAAGRLPGWPPVDLAMIDIQGAETVLLERARDLLTAGRVRFLIVSTHHQSHFRRPADPSAGASTCCGSAAPTSSPSTPCGSPTAATA